MVANHIVLQERMIKVAVMELVKQIMEHMPCDETSGRSCILGDNGRYTGMVIEALVDQPSRAKVESCGGWLDLWQLIDKLVHRTNSELVNASRV